MDNSFDGYLASATVEIAESISMGNLSLTVKGVQSEIELQLEKTLDQKLFFEPQSLKIGFEKEKIFNIIYDDTSPAQDFITGRNYEHKSERVIAETEQLALAKFHESFKHRVKVIDTEDFGTYEDKSRVYVSYSLRSAEPIKIIPITLFV